MVIVKFSYSLVCQPIGTNEFYEKLYKTYPKKDETWTTDKDYRRSSFSKTLRNEYDTEITYDDSLSPEWNEFKKYISSRAAITLTALFVTLSPERTELSSPRWIYGSGIWPTSLVILLTLLTLLIINMGGLTDLQNL